MRAPTTYFGFERTCECDLLSEYIFYMLIGDFNRHIDDLLERVVLYLVVAVC